MSRWCRAADRLVGDTGFDTASKRRARDELPALSMPISVAKFQTKIGYRKRALKQRVTNTLIGGHTVAAPEIF